MLRDLKWAFSFGLQIIIVGSMLGLFVFVILKAFGGKPNCESKYNCVEVQSVR